MKRSRGITLVGLVVTIVVLMILVGISINLVIGENGIITRAKEAKGRQEMAEAREKLELILLDSAVKNDGKVDMDSYLEELENKGMIDPDETQTNPDGSKEVITDNGYVATIVDKGNGEIEVTIDGKVDNLPPKIIKIEGKGTTSEIEITVQAKRAEGAKYRYYYKENGTKEEYQKVEESSNNTCTIEGITQGKKYDIKVEVENKKGTAEGEITVTTGSLPEGTITFGDISWNASTHKATVTVSTSSSGYTLQYATSSSGPWTDIASGGRTTEQVLNTTIYARLTDGTNETGYASTTITERIAPEVTVSITGSSSNSITAAVTAIDNQAGMPANPSYNFYIKKSSEGSYPSAASYTGANTSYTFTGLTQGTAYDIKVTTSDIAGNMGTGTKTSQGTGSLPEGTISFGGVSWNASTHKATVTVSTSASGYTLQYATSSNGPWTTINSGGRTTEQALNTTIYARLWDGTNVTTHATTTITDGTAPSISHTINPTGNTTGTVTITLTVIDNQSGVASVTNTTTTNITKNSNTSYTVSKNGMYSFQAKDNAGNSTNYSVTISNIQEGVLASEIAQNPSETFGKTVTGYTCPNSSGVANWKIFYADDSNVYLIADDYIHYRYVPQGYDLGTTDYRLCFGSVIDSYSGSADIIDTNIKKWLSYVSSYPMNKKNNMKSVAAMLDTELWSGFKGDKADYSIGGPTLDLFVASYNKTHPSKKIQYQIGDDGYGDELGYEVKWSMDTSYNNTLTGINTDECLYVIVSSIKAQGMWLASPSCRASSSIFAVDSTGKIDVEAYGYRYFGFRPLVCLRSDVHLVRQSDGTYKII